ncbi:MAG: 5'-methylthioadenosine/adenosylhomocysteine nucleosidase [Gammaproteobacteria bacterium]|nr:5'-methylthioadenosine/adenosylhomocysteine nucleosidase [Gammaproteobacteria bacterium]
MKIGIMGAMSEEVDSILLQMTNVESIEYGSRTYHTGKINSHDVVLVFSRWGKGAAAITATTLITKFEIDQLIFTGVAGAVSSELNVGDIIVSTQLFQHDMKSKFFPDGEIPLTGITLFKADKTLISRAHRAGCDLLGESSPSRAKITEALVALGITEPNPKCVTGIIATGDQFICTAEQRAEILRQNPETKGAEMEGAAAAQACLDHNVPVVVVRTVSDGADHLAAEKFPMFVEKIARYYSEHIVAGMLSDHSTPTTVENNLVVSTL